MEKKSILKSEFAQSTTERSALLDLSAISLHLRNLNYPETSIQSFLKCGQESGLFFIKYCDHGKNPKDCPDCMQKIVCSPKIISLNHHCNLRVCPDCAKIRQRRFIRHYSPYFRQFSITRGSSKSLYFLTIAPENYSSEKEGLNHIRDSWRKFIRLKYIKERVEGGLWVIETKNTGSGWHIHIHALFYGRRLDSCIRGKCLDCGQNYMKFDKSSGKYFCANRRCNSLNVVVKEDSKLTSLFKSCSDRNCITNVKEMKYGGSRGALNYCLKYVSMDKGDFQDSEQLAKYIVATRKKKLINLFGTFFKFKLIKSKIICRRCDSEIKFIFNIDLINWMKFNIFPPGRSDLRSVPLMNEEADDEVKNGVAGDMAEIDFQKLLFAIGIN